MPFGMGTNGQTEGGDIGLPGPYSDPRKEQFESTRGQLATHQLFTMAVGPQGIPSLSAAVRNFPVVYGYRNYLSYSQFVQED